MAPRQSGPPGPACSVTELTRIPRKLLTSEMTEFLYSQSFLLSALSLSLSTWGWGAIPEALASIKRVTRAHSRCCHRSTPGRASAGFHVRRRERERETRERLMGFSPSPERHVCVETRVTVPRWELWGPPWLPASRSSAQHGLRLIPEPRVFGARDRRAAQSAAHQPPRRTMSSEAWGGRASVPGCPEEESLLPQRHPSKTPMPTRGPSVRPQGFQRSRFWDRPLGHTYHGQGHAA